MKLKINILNYKTSKEILDKVTEYYEKLDKEEKNSNEMCITNYIQIIIKNLPDINPLFINGKWIKIDTIRFKY